jgi:cysteine synthase
LGADVRLVPPSPFTNPDNYYHVAQRIAQSIPGALWADQFNNIANSRGHYRSTGPEIWAACEQIDAFVTSAGTGGTFAGVSAFLKERKPSVLTVLADPMGSSLYSYVKHGTLDFEGDSVSEGIGIKRVTENFKTAVADDAIRIDDLTMVETAYYLLHQEGLLLGGSAALNAAAAARVACTLPPKSTVVTVLCDGGSRYLSRLYNPAWLSEQGLAPRQQGLTFL